MVILGNVRDTNLLRPNPPAVSVSKREFAKRHSVSPRTVDHWRAQGLPALIIGRRKILLPVDLADQWIKDRFLVITGRTMARLTARVGGAAQ